MKTKILSQTIPIFIAFFLVSFTDPYSIKRISDANYRYEFYTTDKKITPKSDRVYFWFKGGLIHNSQAGVGGDVLDDKFVKMYHSNQLAEQGNFKNGLKIGLWKTWFPNGVIETTQKWSKGNKMGPYYRYDENGNLVEKGNFRSNKKHGKWINYENKETIIYKKGIVFSKKIKPSKLEQFKLEQNKKKAKAEKKVFEETEKNKEAASIAAYKTASKQERKALSEKRKTERKIEKDKKTSRGDSKIKVFFKKLFSKKAPKQKPNGKST